MSSIATSSSIVRSPSVSRASRAVNWGRFTRRGLATVAASVLANVLVYFIGSALTHYDPQFLPLADVSGAIIFTLTFAIAAVLVYAPILRFTRNPEIVYTVVAAFVFIVTLIPDIIYIPTVPGATIGQTAILVLMHVVAAVVIVRMLTTFGRSQAR
jgi:4-amino-4-deoxy-L-arabinose transferase-like glycosyltransferase